MVNGINKKILFVLGSWALFIIGLILVIYDFYNLIILGEDLSTHFITGIVLIIEALRVASGELPKKDIN